MHKNIEHKLKWSGCGFEFYGNEIGLIEKNAELFSEDRNMNRHTQFVVIILSLDLLKRLSKIMKCSH